MKKLLALIAVVGLAFQSFAYDPVNEKLIESFKSSFPNAEQVSWLELPASFVVSFVEENIRARAYYNKDGELVQLIRYYKDTQIPFAVLHAIQKEFSGKKIFGVVEVTSTDARKIVETVYYVKLEDARNWTTVKVDVNGNVVVIEKLRKV
jgi:hypothetical protein